MQGSTAVKLDMVQRANFMSDSPQEVKKKLRELIESGEIRLREIEDVVGYKTATLSLHLAGKYEGDAERLDDAMVRFYRQWVAKNTIVNTSVVQQIHGFMELAWKRRRLSAIIGPNGRGKTKAVNRYAAEHQDYAVVVELSAVFTPRDLLNRIGDALRITHAMVGSRSERLQAIVRAIQRKPILLVIDQGDEVSPKAVKLLRDIHGDEQARCGIVIVTTEKFEKILRDPELIYMRRRIRMKLKIAEIAFKEAKEIAGLWPHNLEDGELKKIWEWALRDFGVDSLVKRMDMAYDLMMLQGKRKIDSDCIEDALAYL